MKVGLFIPCYINAVYPGVGRASYELLGRLGCEVDYPLGQTCCGQPMANAGFEKDARALDNYREHACVDSRIWEICEFIHDVVRPAKLDARFPHRVSVHNSCHGVRKMGLSSPSELNVPYMSKLRDLLSLVGDIDIAEPSRRDECCGFGGMFSVEENAVSVCMGRDKVRDHMATGAEYITGADSSCLMHMQGVIDHDKLPIRTIHAVEILNSKL